MKSEDTDRVSLNVKVPATIKARLRAEAKRLGIAEQAVVVMTLDKGLPEYDPRTR